MVEPLVRVKLTGPEARNQWDNRNPSRITVPKLLQTFELVGRDINTGDEVVKYGFVLRQWFVHRNRDMRERGEALAWCNGLGYRMPRIRDLTNAKCGVDGRFPCVNSINGAAPSSSFNRYMRYIGAGFFAEWGLIYYYYRDAGFANDFYWASDVLSGSERFSVLSHDGSVRYTFHGRGLCTTP
ncbi:hypothetical protein [Gilliamella sp. Bif1-4]|uniref:hypothetical protein n=1 Tax=Gilliamella sp. Bif1-4 TaxID=3120233 RepID=UPI00080DB8BF|nr:hypothetical protein [Gilliamella apicola]OCG41923.1 hypothetical protein A9G25_04100 [Gilliamella apicola]